MKKLLLLLFLFGITASQLLNASTTGPRFRHCSISGGSTFYFENCVQDNFRLAERAWDVILRGCYNMDTNPYNFQDCVNHNFSRIESRTGALMRFCSSADRDPYYFASCVNSNFDRLSYSE